MKIKLFFFIAFAALISISWCKVDVWGFYGHRLINKMAVFTLPPEMMGFYKSNMDYMVTHAVDPDMRRYATKHEGVRHFIDIDKWDVIPFPNVPRDFEEAIIKYCRIKLANTKDTFYFDKVISEDSIVLSTESFGGVRLAMSYPVFVKYWKKIVKPMYYEDEWKLSGYDIDELFDTRYFSGNNVDVLIEDHFSEHGIVPYHLEEMLRRLTYAFEKHDMDGVLRLSAEFGHYIADAHVPLHTTSNYNGQLSNQVGIHAFWESRIPELFAEREYDFFVGKAEYIEHPRDYIWNIIIGAHSHLDSVLAIEKRLSQTYESDKQFCYDERLSQTIRIQCEDYAKAYTEAMGSMVEDQMRKAIHATGSFLYTAWVNAGQPEINNTKQLAVVPDKIVADPNVKTRPHE